MDELSSRGSGVPPVKSTFALRRDAGATNDAQILNMIQVLFSFLFWQFNLFHFTQRQISLISLIDYRCLVFWNLPINANLQIAP